MDNITLRKYQVSDVDSFMKWACDPEVLNFSRLQMWINHNSTREDIVGFFNQVVIPHPWFRAICFNDQPIGFISIEPEGANDHDVHRARALLSYALGRDYWCRGIATLAIRRAVPDAFKELPLLLRIEAFVDPDNKASQRVLDKSGFLKEGFLRKYVMAPNGDCFDLIVYSVGIIDVTNG